MQVRQISLVVCAHADPEPAIGLAAALASPSEAFVHAVCLYREPEPVIVDSFAMGAAGIEAAIAHRDDAVARLVMPAQRSFADRFAPERSSWRTAEIVQWCDVVAGWPATADLVVLAAAERDRDMRRVTERLVFSAGAPCLIAPLAPKPFAAARIVVGWNGSREARRAVGDALDLLRRATDVAIATVGDDRGWNTADLCAWLERHGVHAAVRHVSARGNAGHALVAAAEEFGADLLVMGAFSRSRAEERVLGGATRELICGASAPILMSH